MSGRQEHGALLAEEPGELLLELLHGAALQIGVGGDAVLVGDPGQEAGILERRGGHSIAYQVDPSIGRHG